MTVGAREWAGKGCGDGSSGGGGRWWMEAAVVAVTAMAVVDAAIRAGCLVWGASVRCGGVTYSSARGGTRNSHCCPSVDVGSAASRIEIESWRSGRGGCTS